MEGKQAFFPEEILVLILTNLPVKSLVRFTCISKRFRFIIMSDPKFAKSNRILLCIINDDEEDKEEEPYRLESIDLDTPEFGDQSSVRKLTFPFEQPEKQEPLAYGLILLGSANGIVFLTFYYRIFYMWNPSIGLVKRLPNFSSKVESYQFMYFGVGYLPVNDDYRVVLIYCGDPGEDGVVRGSMYTPLVFSTRANVWLKYKVQRVNSLRTALGTSLNEALHWASWNNGIVAFDLAGDEEEEGKFREMSPPNFENEEGFKSEIGVSPGGGCLILTRFPEVFIHGSVDYIDVWVMNEYNVPGSWTKLFNLKLLDDPKGYVNPDSVLLIGTSMVCELNKRDKDKEWYLIRTDHEDEGKNGKYKFRACTCNKIQIKETLRWIHD